MYSGYAGSSSRYRRNDESTSAFFFHRTPLAASGCGDFLYSLSCEARTHTYTLTHTLALTLAHLLSHTHLHSHSRTYTHSHTHTHTHTRTLPHSHAYTDTHTHSHTHTHTHTHSLSLSSLTDSDMHCGVSINRRSSRRAWTCSAATSATALQRVRAPTCGWCGRCAYAEALLFTLYTLLFLHSTLYTLHLTLYTLHLTLYTLHLTLYTLLFTLSTLYTLHLHITLYTLLIVALCLSVSVRPAACLSVRLSCIRVSVRLPGLWHRIASYRKRRRRSWWAAPPRSWLTCRARSSARDCWRDTRT